MERWIVGCDVAVVKNELGIKQDSTEEEEEEGQEEEEEGE